MNTKRLLYASPFPPCKTGIADYSEILVYGLRKFFDITLLIDDYPLSEHLSNDFNVGIYGKHDIDPERYPYRIYNIGNNAAFHGYIYETALKYPGLIILHDVNLYYLLVDHYSRKKVLYSKIYEMYGSKKFYMLRKFAKRGVHIFFWENLALPSRFPLNEELINSDNKIMVHSHHSYEKISGLMTEQHRLRKINLVDQIKPDERFLPKAMLLQKYGIPDDTLLICSFGFLQARKLPHVICQTIQRLNQHFDNKLVYLMVGEGDYADGYVNETIKKTGFVDLVEFNSLIRCADLTINLRELMVGEASAVVIRALALGRPCLVTNTDWFAELPDDVVVKVDKDNVEAELYEKLFYLITHPNARKDLSQKAKQYIEKEHKVEKILEEIVDFLQ